MLAYAKCPRGCKTSKTRGFKTSETRGFKSSKGYGIEICFGILPQAIE